MMIMPKTLFIFFFFKKSIKINICRAKVNKKNYFGLFTHKMIRIADAKRIRSSTSKIRVSVCLPIQLIKPSRAKHSIVTNIAPKNSKVTHSTCCKTESNLQLAKIKEIFFL